MGTSSICTEEDELEEDEDDLEEDFFDDEDDFLDVEELLGVGGFLGFFFFGGVQCLIYSDIDVDYLHEVDDFLLEEDEDLLDEELLDSSFTFGHLMGLG